MAAASRLRFSALWQRLGAAGTGAGAFDALAGAYGEAGRVYHTLDHVLDCLARLDEVEAPPRGRDMVEAAIWFHDVVYDPRRSDNEGSSAEWAGRVLTGAGVPASSISHIQDLVRATDHAAEPAEPDAMLLCDIDLAILGRGRQEFAEYQRRIREEYAWVPERQYRDGRSRILSSFLRRSRIYLTDHFHDRYEAIARINLERALAELAD
ncbi:MAG: HD domain-containing protein [Gemmatimonadales bacterium]